jgi:hypothetical protein
MNGGGGGMDGWKAVAMLSVVSYLRLHSNGGY